VILLDNARHPDQIRQLLPGAAGCVVLVTSRDALTGLVARNGARSLSLDVLSPAEAEALLARVLDAPADEELARLCAYLPLALRIAAATLITTYGGAITAYVNVLRADDRLAALEVSDDPEAAVTAAFDLSYAALPEPERRMFRLLGLIPGADFTPETAAALAGVQDAVPLLATLSNAHLVEEHEGRYQCHDLLRLYALNLTSAEEREQATERLYRWYLSAVDSAARLLYPAMLRLDVPAGPDVVPDHDQALAWLDAERSNLVSAITQGTGPEVTRLADSLRGYFYLRMHVVDWLTVAEAGLKAAEAQGDLKAQAAAYFSLSDAAMRQGQRETAIAHSSRALVLAQQAEWPAGQATTLGNLGNIHFGAGELDQAAGFYRQALDLARRTGRLLGEANLVGNLGLISWQRGRLDEAAEQCVTALGLHGRTGSRHGEALNHGNLGEVRLRRPPLSREPRQPVSSSRSSRCTPKGAWT
jgi:tetratricopeptide (TPR) repeat protein